MSSITLHGNTINTVGELPALGSKAKEFSLAKADLSNATLADFAGQNIILNIFPSVDTGTCAASVRAFNQRASSLANTKVICVSADLPFAFNRFCGAEGIENVITASTFRSTFGQDYGVEIKDSGMQGLMSRAVVVIDTQGNIAHTEQVLDIVNEPNYDAAINAIK